MITKFCFLSSIILIIAAMPCRGQNLFPESGPIYQDDIVSRIDITLPADSLEIILAPGNEESDYHFHATFQFDNGEIQETIENVGFRLRGNTSRYSQKKSFKVSFNTYESGRSWYGVEKLNLNGEHNDPTVSRSKICWDFLKDIRVPASRATHTELYINGEYFGLYANIEHIDEEFVELRFGNNDGNLYKCLWPADLNYLGEDPDLYKFMNGNRRAYELKTNEEDDDYSDLAHFIDVLNRTPIENLECELGAIFNVNTFLKAMAFDVLSGNWDGPLYNKNNFYLYNNEATGKFEYIPYDLDNTFGIDWFQIDWALRNIYEWGHQSESRPLYWRVLQVDSYRDRFSFYLNQMIVDHYSVAELFPSIDAMRDQIQQSIANDPFYPLDYGFDLDDFKNGFFQPLDHFHTVYGIKDFFISRRNATISQLDLNEISPMINYTATQLIPLESAIRFETTVQDDKPGVQVQVCYQMDESGNLECFDLYDDGAHDDGNAGDGVYSNTLTEIDQSGTIEFTIKAIDSDNQISNDPFCGTYQIEFASRAVSIAINEFMASNDTTLADEFGEYDDWVEVYNYGTEAVSLVGMYISDKSDNPTKWACPDTTIQAGEYLIIWADDDEEQGSMHSSFKLSAGGEFIGVFDSDSTLVDGIEFGEQETDVSFGRIPNGTGAFQFMTPTPGMPNEVISSTKQDLNFPFEYTVYPNPTTDFFHVRFDQFVQTPMTLELRDMMGQIVDSRKLQETLTFDVRDWPSGLYILTVPEIGFAIGKMLIK